MVTLPQFSGHVSSLPTLFSQARGDGRRPDGCDAPSGSLPVLRERRRRGASAACVRPRRPGRVDFGQATDFASNGEQVVGGVQGLLGGVQLVEHGADQSGLPDVLRDADPLRIGCASDRRICAVREPDRCRVQSHGRNFTRGTLCDNISAIAVANISSNAVSRGGISRIRPAAFPLAVAHIPQPPPAGSTRPGVINVTQRFAGAGQGRPAQSDDTPPTERQYRRQLREAVPGVIDRLAA